MTNVWRAAGLTYIQYSNICARVVRQALKSDLRAEAAKRNDSNVKFTPWANGKPALSIIYGNRNGCTRERTD